MLISLVGAVNPGLALEEDACPSRNRIWLSLPVCELAVKQRHLLLAIVAQHGRKQCLWRCTSDSCWRSTESPPRKLRSWDSDASLNTSTWSGNPLAARCGPSNLGPGEDNTTAFTVRVISINGNDYMLRLKSIGSLSVGIIWGPLKGWQFRHRCNTSFTSCNTEYPKTKDKQQQNYYAMKICNSWMKHLSGDWLNAPNVAPFQQPKQYSWWETSGK